MSVEIFFYFFFKSSKHTMIFFHLSYNRTLCFLRHKTFLGNALITFNNVFMYRYTLKSIEVSKILFNYSQLKFELCYCHKICNCSSFELEFALEYVGKVLSLAICYRNMI